MTPPGSSAAAHSPGRPAPALPPLAVLTVVAGWVDAVAYLTLGHVYTANQTGNVVLLAASLTAGLHGDPAPGPEAALPLCSVCGFCAGLLLGSWLAHGGGPAVAAGGTPPVFLEGALLTAVATVHGVGVVSGAAAFPRLTLVATVACAMGLQGAHAAHLSRPGMNTVVITGTMMTTVNRLFGAPGGRRGAVTPLLVVVGYIVGAAGGTLVTSQFAPFAYAPPAALVLVTWVSTGRRRRDTVHHGGDEGPS